MPSIERRESGVILIFRKKSQHRSKTLRKEEKRKRKRKFETTKEKQRD